MPKLQLFAVCQNVITSQEENVPTLVSVIDGFIIEAPAGFTEGPQGALAPGAWAVFASWKKRPGDEGKRFEQQIRMTLPNGESGTTPIRGFDFPPPRKVVRITSRQGAFPVIPGDCLVELLFREVGAEDWTVVADYVIDVEFRVKDAEAPPEP